MNSQVGPNVPEHAAMAGNDTESTLTVVGEMDLIMASVLLSKLVHDPTDPKMSVDKLEMKLRHIYEHQIIQRALSTQSVMKTSLLNSLNGALPLDALSRLTIIRVPRRPLRAQDILREMPNPKVFLGNGGRIFVKEALLAAVREIRSQTKARALAEMQKGKGSSTYSRPPTPVADEGIGDLQFQVKVEKWHTVNTDTLEDMQGMLLEEEKFGNRVLRLFSLLTVLEVGVENPLRWWPVFLRAAARDLVIE